MTFGTHAVLAMVVAGLTWFSPGFAQCSNGSQSDAACCCSAPEPERLDSCCASEPSAPQPGKEACHCHVQQDDGTLPADFEMVLPGPTGLKKISDTGVLMPDRMHTASLARFVHTCLSTAGPPDERLHAPGMSCVYRL